MLPRSYTFIVPHQRATSGGVYVIEQWARHLAAHADVGLAVRRGPIRAVAGVRVFAAPELSPRELPEADVVVGGLGQPDPERVAALPRSHGEQVFLFQGHGAPGNPRVGAMLARRPRVVAVSELLAERARREGCQVELVRPGLDRAIFHPGRACAERGSVVTMLAHAAAGKATRDGVDALARVREVVPEVELRLFGAAQPPPMGSASSPQAASLDARFLGELPREAVGALLRETAVFVCSSLEEGLGLPGIEALACGAALASTDTGGSRDYAVHGRTALVTPPGRPELLAESVIRLLGDGELRGRLLRQGQERMAALYPSWRASAERFHEAVARLLDHTDPPVLSADPPAGRTDPSPVSIPPTQPATP